MTRCREQILGDLSRAKSAWAALLAAQCHATSVLGSPFSAAHRIGQSCCQAENPEHELNQHKPARQQAKLIVRRGNKHDPEQKEIKGTCFLE